MASGKVTHMIHNLLKPFVSSEEILECYVGNQYGLDHYREPKYQYLVTQEFLLGLLHTNETQKERMQELEDWIWELEHRQEGDEH